MTFGSDLILSKHYSPYTIIAHGRFEFTGADGASWRMDMAAAHLGVVVKPQTKEKTLETSVIMIGTIVAGLALVFQIGLLIITMVHYSNKIMKLSQVNVLAFMVVAAIIGILIVMFTFGTASDAMCPMKGFVTVPLTFMVGLLYGKVCKAQVALPRYQSTIPWRHQHRHRLSHSPDPTLPCRLPYTQTVHRLTSFMLLDAPHHPGEARAFVDAKQAAGSEEG